MRVPFVDLGAQHAEVRSELDAIFCDILDHSSFIGGPYVTQFEANFAAYCEAAHAVAVADGTSALRLALKAVGVQPGDDVITVANTFIATVEAITQVGAYPVFVDIDPETANMSPDCVARFLAESCERDSDGTLRNRDTGRPVTTILPVHLYGQPADLVALMLLAQNYGLWLVEDACQAHGARVYYHGEWRRAGSLGHAAAFSFYPGKNLGAIGEGGAVVTNDASVADTIRVLRDHGQRERYIHVTADGCNARLDALQCAVLDVKLHKLDGWNDNRRQAAAWYKAHLSRVTQLQLPIEKPGLHHVYHLFVVRVPDRERVRQDLAEQGVAAALHYPIPLHLQEAYRYLGIGVGTLPYTEAWSNDLLSLPLFPHITEAQVAYVCDVLLNVLHGHYQPS